MEYNLKPIGLNRYRLLQNKNELPAVVYLNPSLLTQVLEEQEALKQLADATFLPGVVNPVIDLPDIHSGFGLPIGGVLVTDPKNGVISAGAVGMDINCGVRLLRTNLQAEEVSKEDLLKLIKAIEKRIPTGVGKKTKIDAFRRFSLEEIVQGGVPYIIDKGYGCPEDKEVVRDNGLLATAEPKALSNKARQRADQLATIGGGNHFIEIGKVDKVFADERTAALIALTGLKEGDISIILHTGSRGFGHQVCVDYSALMLKAAEKSGIKLPSRGLAAVHFDSQLGKDYFAAMSCAANYAFVNRQLLTYLVRESFEEVFASYQGSLGLELVCDVAHNLASLEGYDSRRILVHRKGAVLALPPLHHANSPYYFKTGQPVLVPGSMGTASYLLVATSLARETFYSVNHGAGRILSRKKAAQSFSEKDLALSMSGILVNSKRLKSLADEAPAAYKDIEEVISTFTKIGITLPVARFMPLAVVKGEGSEG